jgi:SAM-dependent methyltransferase
MTGLPDYRYDPVAYELEERARPDEMMMLRGAEAAAYDWLSRRQEAHALDLCCGTGLSTRCLVEHPNVATVVGVDNSEAYLEYARSAFRGSRIAPLFLLADAATVESNQLGRDTWDIIMMASAYHHIENNRKLSFLRRVHQLLGASGRAVMAENILPSYSDDDPDSYRQAVEQFYACVLRTARRDNPALPLQVAQLIERVAQYGYDGDYEYKVCMSILLRDLAASGLEVISIQKVWPSTDELGVDGGNFVLLLRAV